MIEIPFSKTKIVLMFLGCLLFISLGIWFISNPPVDTDSILGNEILLRIIGGMAILFGVIIGFVSVKKLFDQRPGLIISSDGITDHSSGLSVGFIPWEDVVEIRELTMHNQHFISIVVLNPQSYIDRQQNALKRKMMQLNQGTYSTVITISANTLQCSFKELKMHLTTMFDQYHR